MKLNLKSTIAAPADNKSCQKALNGIIGNTRRGIVVDKTLDPDSNNPVANKPVSTALAALAGKIDAALQRPTGLTKTKLVGVGTSGQENIEIGDNLTLIDGKLAAAGGSVSPMLNLLDFSGPDDPTVRTSITEEEKTNIEKGLYNSVLYVDTSLGDDAITSIYFSENATYIDGILHFSIYNVSATGDTSVAINNLHVYTLNIGEKNADGTYPIVIENRVRASFGGGRGTSLLNLIDRNDRTIRTSITETEKENIEKGTYNSIFYYDPTMGDEWAVMTAFYPKQIAYYGDKDSLDFSAYQFSSDGSITGSIVYSLNVRKDKNEDGTYPITIDRFSDAPFAAIKITFED